MDSDRAAAQALHDVLQRFATAAMQAYDDVRMSAGLNVTDMSAMMFLIEHEDPRARDLSSHLNISSASTTVLLDRLEERHLIRRRPDPSDRRAIRVEVLVSADDEPWASLDRFEEEVVRAASAHPTDEVEDAADLVADVTERAAERSNAHTESSGDGIA